MNSIEELSKNLAEFLNNCRCKTCHNPASIIVLDPLSSFCKECYEWIFMKDDYVFFNGMECARTVPAREAFLEWEKKDNGVPGKLIWTDNMAQYDKEGRLR